MANHVTQVKSRILSQLRKFLFGESFARFSVSHNENRPLTSVFFLIGSFSNVARTLFFQISWMSSTIGVLSHANNEPFMSRPISHYNDVIMSAMASQITSLAIVYSIVYSVADQRKHQSPASLAFVQGIHRWPVNSPHKGPATWKMFLFDDVIMLAQACYITSVLGFI